MNDRLELLTDAWRDGTLTADDAAELSDLLRSDAAALRRFQEETRLHGLLHAAASAIAIEECAGISNTKRPAAAAFFNARPSRSVLQAVAVGLFFGVCCTSLAWAIVEPNARRIKESDSLLFSDDFSPGINPARGFPTAFDRWSGDPTDVVERPGVGGVLRFIQAESDSGFAGDRAHWCDVFRIVDLRPLRGSSAAEDSVLELEAQFLVDREIEPHLFCARLFAFDGEMSTLGQRWPNAMKDALALGAVHVKSASGGTPLQTLQGRTKIVVPSAADFVVVQLTVTPDRPLPSGTTASFSSHYVDEVRLTLRERNNR